MKDEEKIREQLTEELEELRRRVTELEKSETERKQAEDALRKHIHDLGERRKELNCLYGISELTERQDFSREELLQAIVNLIPPAWQYPEITCARLIVEGAEHRGANFRETMWKLAKDITVHGERVGTVEVFYLEERSAADEGPFLQEERSLINAIAERLARILERTIAEEELGRYKLIVSAVHDPMSFIDSNYIYRTVNLAYTKIFKKTREEIIGLSVAEMFGKEIFEKQLKGYLDRCFAGEEVHYRDWLDFPDGKRRCMHTDYYPFFENDKCVSGVVVNARDMTDLELAEGALRESEENLVRAQRVSHIGNWSWDTVTNRISWSDELYRIVGLSPQEFDASYEAYLKCIHPDDLEFFKNLTGNVLKEKKPYDAEYRIVRSNDDIRIVHEQGEVTVDMNGNPISVFGTVQDITERKGVEEALRESEEFASSLLNNSPNPILVLNPDGSMKYINPALEKLTGFYSSELIGSKPPYPWWPEKLSETIASDFDEAILKGTYRLEKLFRNKKGERFWVEITSTPVVSNDDTKYYLVNWVEITERKRAEEDIRGLSLELIKTQEVERQRIAADLHDRLAQDLATIRIGLNTLYADQPNIPDEGRQRVFELAALVQHNIVTVRDIAYGLHPPSLKEFGLVYTVQQYCDEFAGKNSLKVDFFSVGMDDLELDFDTQIAFYRLIQEGLTNISKHADASQINVRLSASFSHIMLHIEDNGKGFEVNNRLAAALDERRMGIWSMKQRVAFLNGEMKIESDRMHGTKILIKVPHMDKTNG